MFPEVSSYFLFLLLLFLLYEEHNNTLIITCYAFRWKEFCIDTSLEKASLYLQNEDGNLKSTVDGLTTLADCLSDWPEIATGSDRSIGIYEWCEQFPSFSHSFMSLSIFVLYTCDYFHC